MNAQRLHRPNSPHFTIYQPQVSVRLRGRCSYAVRARGCHRKGALHWEESHLKAPQGLLCEKRQREGDLGVWRPGRSGDLRVGRARRLFACSEARRSSPHADGPFALLQPAHLIGSADPRSHGSCPSRTESPASLSPARSTPHRWRSSSTPSSPPSTPRTSSTLLRPCLPGSRARPSSSLPCRSLSTRSTASGIWPGTSDTVRVPTQPAGAVELMRRPDDQGRVRRRIRHAGCYGRG